MGEQCPLGVCRACEQCLRNLLLHVSLHTHVTKMNFRVRDNVQGLSLGETPPPTWQQNEGCLDTRLKGTGKSLASQSGNFAPDEQSEPRDPEGWQRLALQGDPAREDQEVTIL